MSDRETIARLYRRASFGLAPGELDEREAEGVEAVIDRLIDPDRAGVTPGPTDLWAGMEFPLLDSSRGAMMAVSRWLDHLLMTERPFEEWMAWYWHGHLVSSVAEVANVPMMTGQISLLRRSGLGAFPDLLRAITIDPAMLSYLNGDESTGDDPNENYAREMLELFALGLGYFTEADVRAGARALTGWRVRLTRTDSEIDPLRASSWFDASLHDDTPRDYLEDTGVHDLDTVVSAVTSLDACSQFVAGRFGRALLGPEADAGLLQSLGETFRAADLDLRVLARRALEALAEGRHAGLVLGPMPWLLAAQRATGAVLDATDRYTSLYDAGHLPLWPPNVGGWPGGTTWLASSTTAQRFNLAGALAARTPEDNPARMAAAVGDLAALADALGRPEGFAVSTRDALADLAGNSGDDGTAVLTVALAAPDLVMG